MTYEVIEDIRNNRNDLTSLNYIIPNKHVKTYHVKHKPDIKPSQIENVLVHEFNEDLKFEYIPETDDENTTLDKIKFKCTDKKLKSEIKELTQPDFDINDCDDDGFDLESLANTLDTEIADLNSEINDENTVKRESLVTNYDIVNGNKTLEIFNTDNKLNIEDSRDSLLFSLLNTKPKRSKKKIEIETDSGKPRKFEKKKKTRINNENWEVKILTEQEALEQFKQRVNNNKYIKFSYKCDKCLKGFSRNDILLRHNKQCHDKVRASSRNRHTIVDILSELCSSVT